MRRFLVFSGVLGGFLLSVGAASPAGSSADVNSIGIRLVAVPAGSFQMGQEGPQSDYLLSKHPEKFDDADWDEKPVHRVTISKPFLMGATEVTNAQYEQFDPGHAGIRRTAACSKADDEPVVEVTWNDAVKFCAWLSAKEKKPYRLPTEAEWEYACRAGTTTLFNTGDSLPDGSTVWLSYQTKSHGFSGKAPPRQYRMPPGPEPLRVAQQAPNAWGLYDMHGNVAEWCLDWYGPYEAGDQTDPTGRSSGDFRVVRGGSHSEYIRMLRSANRAALEPDQGSIWNGFRVVQAPMPATAPIAPPPPPLNQRDVSQAVPEIKPVDATKPFFRGPQIFVKIPPGSMGPLFSKHNHSPSLVGCPNGDLLAVWFSCVEETGSELCVAASRLRHGAAEWEEASPFWDTPDVNDHYPKLFFDGDKTIYFFTAGLEHNIFRMSVDNGATWSVPQPVLPLGEVGNSGFKTVEGYFVQPHDGPCSFLLSRDKGKTWTYNADALAKDKLAVAPGQTGPCAAGIHLAMAQLKDGSIMSIGRFDKAEQQERFHGFAPISITKDWGKTWSYSESPFPVISSAQRAVLLRLHEGPLLYCSFTDQWSKWHSRKGFVFPDSAGGQFTGYGLYAALSYDGGKSWPIRKLVTDGSPEHRWKSTDDNPMTMSPTLAEPFGYLAIYQTRDDVVQLVSSKNYYAFNLTWILEKAAP
jgi:formylglycine-generating enzyme required for sulfatase activity